MSAPASASLRHTSRILKWLQGQTAYRGGGDSLHSTSVECLFSITPLPRAVPPASPPAAVTELLLLLLAMDDASIIARLHAILKVADLARTTVKNLRRQLEAEFKTSLNSRKQLIRDVVRAALSRPRSGETKH